MTLLTASEGLRPELWFVVLFGASALCMLVGLYSIASAYFPLPMPQTLVERHAAPIKQGLTDAQLAQECASLGDAIANFAAVRVMQAPMRYDDPLGSAQTHRVAMANHERESMDQYGDGLGRQVRAVGRELKVRFHIGDAERDDMTNPASMDDVAWIGCRLSELGRYLA